MEIISAAPSGADSRVGQSGGWRHRLISYGPSGPQTITYDYTISKTLVHAEREIVGVTVADLFDHRIVERLEGRRRHQRMFADGP